MGDLGSIPGSGRFPGEGNGNPLQYSCLENPMDRGAWWATVHGVAKSQTRLNNFISFFFFYVNSCKWMPLNLKSKAIISFSSNNEIQMHIILEATDCSERIKIKRNYQGTSLVQWLRLHVPNAGGPGSFPGQGTRFHMLQLRPITAK